MSIPQNYNDQVREVLFKNISGREIPPFGCLFLEGFNVEEDCWEATAPTSDSQLDGLVFNDDMAVPDGEYGLANRDYPTWANFDTDGSGAGSGFGSGDFVPGRGQIWGTKAGSFYLDSDQSGFRVLCEFDTDTGGAMVDFAPFTLPDGDNDSGGGGGGAGGSGSGDGCQYGDSFTIRECNASVYTDRTITAVPGGFRVCSSPVSSGG